MAISTQYGQSTDFFGHQDYFKALSSGVTQLQIKQYLDANPGKLRGNNVRGGGGLYDEINVQAGFDAQMAELTKKMESQQASYDKNLESMKNTLMATMQPNTRESVLGIKGATTGSLTDNSAMARQGITGTFGRSGMRIKKIKDKALNVT